MNLKRLSSLAILLIMLVTIGCTCKPPLITSLPVTLHPQETGMWCWAASGQMVMHYLGHDVDQCTQANNRFGRSDCCTIDLCPSPTEPSSHACVTGGWPEFDKYGFTFDRTSDAALSWDDLRKQTSQTKYCKGKPFAFSWHWPGGGGHMMVVKGYLSLEGTKYVAVLDPWAPCTGAEYIWTYDYYVESTGHHTHWDDFYNVTYTGGS